MKSRNGGAKRQDEMKRNGLSSSPSEPIRNAAFDGLSPGVGARPCGRALSCDGAKERVISWETQSPPFASGPETVS